MFTNNLLHLTNEFDKIKQLNAIMIEAHGCFVG